MEFILRFLLDHEVRFRTSGNAELTGEVGNRKGASERAGKALQYIRAFIWTCSEW